MAWQKQQARHLSTMENKNSSENEGRKAKIGNKQLEKKDYG